MLVADPWQSQGLSDSLTDYCLEIAEQWGVALVYAETTPENHRMIAVLRAHGFDVKSKLDEGVVVGRRETEADAG